MYATPAVMKLTGRVAKGKISAGLLIACLLLLASACGKAVAPSVPQSVDTVAGDGQVTISWSSPNKDGGSTITHYTIVTVPGGARETVSASSLSTTIRGLTNGVRYTFTVSATNVAGTSPGSPSDAVTPSAVPSAPKNVGAVAGDAEVVIAWSPPDSDGGSQITKYTITSSPQVTPLDVNVSELKATITGLTNGVSHAFTVTATNSAGESAGGLSDPVTPIAAPSAPQDVTAVAGDSEATIAWSVPESDGGSEITKFTITSTPDSAPVTVSGSTYSATVTNLENGESYTFTVAATNLAGVSESSAAPVVPYSDRSTVIRSETQIVIAPGEELTIDISPAEIDGFYALRENFDGLELITHTADEYSDGVFVQLQAQGFSYTVRAPSLGTGLQKYVIQGTFWEDPGDEQPLDDTVVSVQYLDSKAPSPPRNVAAVAGDSAATVTWNAPNSDGGSEITQYGISSTPSSEPTSVDGATFTATITGLTNGESYTFTVTAANSVGTSEASAPPVVPFSSGPTVTRSVSEITVNPGEEITIEITPVEVDGFYALRENLDGLELVGHTADNYSDGVFVQLQPQGFSYTVRAPSAGTGLEQHVIHGFFFDEPGQEMPIPDTVVSVQH